MWQRKTGADDLQTVVDGEVERGARRAGRGPRRWSGWRAGATGNAAFDQWKAAELARLEAERRKLEDARANSPTSSTMSATPRTARSSSAS